MCGRFGCSLGAEDLSCATCYKNPKTGLYLKTPCLFVERAYKPSCNIPPTMQAPILINENEDSYSPVMVLARFGAVPPWLSGASSSTHQYETHLCRFESISKSAVYSRLLRSGWRCVVPCTAYFEWQTTKGPNKQPYCFFNKDNSLEDLVSTSGIFSEEKGWSGVNLLYLAGLYSVHVDAQNEKKDYSFAIITQETNEDWTWVHHRMPMVLQSEDDVKRWLDSKNVPAEEALKILFKPIKNLSAHAVDKSKVNNPKNNIGVECFKKFEQKKSNFINEWLQSSSKNKTNELPKHENKTKIKPNFLSQWLKQSSDNLDKENSKNSDVSNKRLSSEEAGSQAKKIKKNK